MKKKKINATFVMDETLWDDLSRDLKDKHKKYEAGEYNMTTSDLVALKVLFNCIELP